MFAQAHAVYYFVANGYWGSSGSFSLRLSFKVWHSSGMCGRPCGSRASPCLLARLRLPLVQELLPGEGVENAIDLGTSSTFSDPIQGDTTSYTSEYSSNCGGAGPDMVRGA